VGPLALWDPFRPAGEYRLDLAKADERKLALIIASLGTPGKTLIDEAIDGVPVAFDSKERRTLFNQGIYTATLLKHVPVPEKAKTATKDDDETATIEEQTIVQTQKPVHTVSIDTSWMIATEKLGWQMEEFPPLSSEENLEEYLQGDNSYPEGISVLEKVQKIIDEGFRSIGTNESALVL